MTRPPVVAASPNQAPWILGTSPRMTTENYVTSSPSYLVDSHCHLDYPELARDLAGVMARARNVGVGHMLTIGTKISAFPGVLAAAEQYPNVSCSVGIHPHDAATEAETDAAKLIELARHPKVVAFGETGPRLLL